MGTFKIIKDEVRKIKARAIEIEEVQVSEEMMSIIEYEMKRRPPTVLNVSLVVDPGMEGATFGILTGDYPPTVKAMTQEERTEWARSVSEGTPFGESDG